MNPVRTTRGVVIVAGGTGRRMESDIPKQYMDLHGKPLIVHTIDRFLEFDPHIKVILVLAGDHKRYWERIAGSHDRAGSFMLASGGRTRYDSVKSGLQLIERGMIVGIHDAVRPLVSHQTIVRCYACAEKEGSAIPAVTVEESVRRINAQGSSEQMDRSRLRMIQTPQVFRSEMIKEAYDRTDDPGFTDDASVFESVFQSVTLVEGNRENIKITSQADFRMASFLMGTQH
jgi:2-C-methyl-D-erythritol 4-phosphate cytidylyltransferase